MNIGKQVNYKVGTVINSKKDLTVTLKVKKVYGNSLIYPVCKKAEMFATLIGKKTFSSQDLNGISFLGFQIEFENIPSEQIQYYKENGFGSFYLFLNKWDG